MSRLRQLPGRVNGCTQTGRSDRNSGRTVLRRLQHLFLLFQRGGPRGRGAGSWLSRFLLLQRKAQVRSYAGERTDHACDCDVEERLLRTSIAVAGESVITAATSGLFRKWRSSMTPLTVQTATGSPASAAAIRTGDVASRRPRREWGRSPARSWCMAMKSAPHWRAGSTTARSTPALLLRIRPNPTTRPQRNSGRSALTVSM